MTQKNCPVCGTPNDVTRDQLQLYLKNGQIKPCESCGFPLVPWIQYATTNATASDHHFTEPVLQWSKSKWSEIHQLKDELSNKNKAIENLQIELDRARAELDNKNLDQTTQVAQLDDSGEETALEVNTENIEDLWEQLKPHFTSYINQEIQKQQDALTQAFRNHLDEMRAGIEKDIEARFKEQNQIELPDQTQSDHDSSGTETSSDTLSSLKQDTIGANTEIKSSRVTSSSIDSQPDDWSWLNDSKPDDRTVVSPDNIEEMRAKDAPILLTQQTPGSYWIVKHPHSSILYLVPDPKFSANEHNIEYTKKIFNCQNYDDLKRQTFQVQQPAIVKQLETEKKWEIQEKGKLIFVSRN